MMGESLSLSDVHVRRGGRTILHVNNLRISANAFVGVIGTNGAGKTTLLQVCCGLMKPNRGTVRFADADLANVSPWSKSNLRKHIGYIPQAAEYNAELPFTVREVVTMGRISAKPLLRRLNGQDRRIVDVWMDKLGLRHLADQTFRSLSGGEQQKTLVARAMAQDPTVLMLDEPCANLDFNWKYQLTQIIEELYHQANITILMVSHDTSLLPPSCRRVVLLHQGAILADGDFEAVLASGSLETAYDCRIETRSIGGRKYVVNKSQTHGPAST
jgi:ABC-type cobalamin/Fe3+-siderophores transport system ATPase subunit